MAKITYPTKATGDQFFATEANEIKTVVNGLDEAIKNISTPVSPTGVSFSTAPGTPTVTNTGITETASVVNNNGTTVNIPSLLMSYTLAAAGKKRRDAIVVDYLNATPTYVRIAGTEVASTDVVPTPSIPANRLFVRYLDISDGAATAYQSELSAVTAALAGKMDKTISGGIVAGQTWGAKYIDYIANPSLFGDYTSYIGSNVERFKDVGDVWKWKVRGNGQKNGGYLEVTDLLGNVKIASIPSTGTADRVILDADMLLLLKAPAVDKADKDLSINTQTGSYTLALTDRGGMVRMNVASANTLTVPPNSAVAFPVGTQIVLAQAGAGQTEIVPGSGVTVNSSGNKKKMTGQYSGATLIKVTPPTTDAANFNYWLLMGDLSA